MLRLAPHKLSESSLNVRCYVFNIRFFSFAKGSTYLSLYIYIPLPSISHSQIIFTVESSFEKRRLDLSNFDFSELPK